MTVNLYDIHAHKRQDNYLETSPELEAKMLSLQEYEDIAKQCIGALVAGPLARTMLRDEDAIAHIMHCLMEGTARWDGRGSHHGYLKQCASWGIHRWIATWNKQQAKESVLSLNTHVGEGERMQLYEVTPDTRHAEQERMRDVIEQAQACLNVSTLTDHQRQCLELHYLEGVSQTDIAARLGISRQAVHHCINNGLEKIRAAVNEQICT